MNIHQNYCMSDISHSVSTPLTTRGELARVSLRANFTLCVQVLWLAGLEEYSAIVCKNIKICVANKSLCYETQNLLNLYCLGISAELESISQFLTPSGGSHSRSLCVEDGS